MVMFALAILEQFWNAESPMLLTEFGILIVPNEVLFWNALAPIDNKFPPSAIPGIREQFLNALVPIDVIFPAMVNALVILLQLLNA